MTEIEQLLSAALAASSAGLAEPGDWLTGAERIDAWAQVRDAATNPLDAERKASLSPYAGDAAHQPSALLSASAVEVVHRIATDPGRLTRSWAEKAMADLGEETYAELVGVTSMAVVIDLLDHLLGDPVRPLPDPIDGAPAEHRPDGVGDIGAWVSQSLDKRMANVSRALSLVPVTEAVWRPLVTDLYSRGPEFAELKWDRNLNRPQVELVAARTTALNECFY